MEKHGGKREGAGRPPFKDEKMERHEIYLSQSEWAKLKAIGDGNASYAIRALLIDGQCPKCGAQISTLDLA